MIVVSSCSGRYVLSRVPRQCACKRSRNLSEQPAAIEAEYADAVEGVERKLEGEVRKDEVRSGKREEPCDWRWPEGAYRGRGKRSGQPKRHSKPSPSLAKRRERILVLCQR